MHHPTIKTTRYEVAKFSFDGNKFIILITKRHHLIKNNCIVFIFFVKKKRTRILYF
jgi:hypothetical protein